MTTVNELYDLAENENISIFSVDLPLTQSVAIVDGHGACYIGMDPFALKTYAEEKEHLAHELGHCVTGSFYNQYSDCDIIAKAEYRANKWAIKKLIPEDELMNAFKLGYTETWQLSELFDVPEQFLRLALNFYHDEALAS